MLAVRDVSDNFFLDLSSKLCVFSLATITIVFSYNVIAKLCQSIFQRQIALYSPTDTSVNGELEVVFH